MSSVAQSKGLIQRTLEDFPSFSLTIVTLTKPSNLNVFRLLKLIFKKSKCFLKGQKFSYMKN